MFQKDIIIHLIKFSVSFLNNCFFCPFQQPVSSSCRDICWYFPQRFSPNNLCAARARVLAPALQPTTHLKKLQKPLPPLTGEGSPGWNMDHHLRGTKFFGVGLGGVEERDLKDFCWCFLVSSLTPNSLTSPTPASSSLPFSSQPDHRHPLLGSLSQPSDWGSPVSALKFAGLPWVVLPSRWMLGSKLQRWGRNWGDFGEMSGPTTLELTKHRNYTLNIKWYLY